MTEFLPDRLLHALHTGIVRQQLPWPLADQHTAPIVDLLVDALGPELRELEHLRNESAGRTPEPFDPDLPCPHEHFNARVDVGRLTRSDDDPTVVGYAAEITVECAGCGERFRWIGVPAGMSAGRPMCSVDEFELRAPIRPASADPDFGLGLPGFAVTMREDGQP